MGEGIQVCHAHMGAGFKHSSFKRALEQSFPFPTSQSFIKCSLQSIYWCIMKLLPSIIKSSLLAINEQIQFLRSDPRFSVALLISFSQSPRVCVLQFSFGKHFLCGPGMLISPQKSRACISKLTACVCVCILTH